MPREQNDLSQLWDMLRAATKIQEFISGKTFHAYSRDEILQSAVERKVEIIGEAARAVSYEFKGKHPEIPWHGIIAQRHFRPMSTARFSRKSCGGLLPYGFPSWSTC